MIAAGVALVLISVAVSGALAPVVRRVRAPAEDYPSPLRSRRRALLLEMDDLDGARAEGSLSVGAYTAARTGIERRLAAVDARLARGRSAGAAPSPEAPRSRMRRATTTCLVVVLVAAVAVPTMLSAATLRAPGEPITGTLPSLSVPGGGSQSLSTLRARVRETPGDIASRLALARAEFDRGRLGDASTQYLAVLRLDPTNPEATARLGLILGLSGRADEGVRAIDRALELDPTYREAFLFRAVLELRALREPRKAIRDVRAFLRAGAEAPADTETRTARRLLARARAELAVSSSGGSGT